LKDGRGGDNGEADTSRIGTQRLGRSRERGKVDSPEVFQLKSDRETGSTERRKKDKRKSVISKHVFVQKKLRHGIKVWEGNLKP